MTPNHSASPQGSRSAARNLAQLCSLCQEHRLGGSLLSFRPGTSHAMLWVCDDCQNKLARRVDDEGALGG